jgi:hypothetical protein
MQRAGKFIMAAMAASTLTIVAGVAMQPAAPAAQARLGALKVMLWYEGSGRLSPNIAPPQTVTLWNTCIGAGDAEESANDVLFTAEVRTRGQQNVTQPVTLTATTQRGTVLARRVFPNVLTSNSGTVSLPLWVSDVGCGVGQVRFSARLGSQTASTRLDFAGGE